MASSIPTKEHKLLTDFKIQKLLGSGSYGIVLEVENISDKQSYFIHVAPGDENCCRELQTFGQLQNHKNVVHYISIWKEVIHIDDVLKKIGINPNDFLRRPGEIDCNKIIFIQTEVYKEDLRDWMGRQKSVTQRQVEDIFTQIVKGLEHIHSFNIAHRNLKPENVFLCGNSENVELQLVKIGNLGFSAHKITNSAPNTISLAQSLHLAPEKSSSKYGKPSDLYALGLILFELISPNLQPASNGGSIDVLHKSLEDLKDRGIFPIGVQNAWPKATQLILKLIPVDPEMLPGFKEILAAFTVPVPSPRRVKQDGKVQAGHLGGEAVSPAGKNKETVAKPLPGSPGAQMADDKKPFCEGCRLPVTGKYSVTNGKPWHIECFKCTKCSKIMDKFFLEKGNYYCVDDYHKLFSPRCAGCGEPCQSGSTSAIGNTWHPEHFNCFKCGTNLYKMRFYEQDGQPYCDDDYHYLFSVRCESCKEPCRDGSLKAIGKFWHHEHFNCIQCSTNLSKSAHYDYNGKPYCADDYLRIFNPKR